MRISDWSSDVCSSDLQSDDSELATPKPKRPADALKLAREYYEEWFPSAGEFFETYEFAFSKKRYKQAAFLLHQTTERLYNTLLLTCTFYTSHSHNIEKIGRASCRERVCEYV